MGFRSPAAPQQAATWHSTNGTASRECSGEEAGTEGGRGRERKGAHVGGREVQRVGGRESKSVSGRVGGREGSRAGVREPGRG